MNLLPDHAPAGPGTCCPGYARRFDDWAASYDLSPLQTVLYGPVHDMVLRYARQHVRHPGMILDVGCGTGRLSARLASAYDQARLEHPRRQPRPDHFPAGKGPDRRQQVRMVELVERRGQVRVKGPYSCGPAALARVVDRLDRVLAAAARPEPVGPGFEPGLPLRLQRVLGPCLVTAVHEHGNAERAQLRIGLRYIHPPDRQGLPGADAAVHPHRQRHPGRGGQRDLPVDPRRLAAGVALRRPAARYLLTELNHEFQHFRDEY